MPEGDTVHRTADRLNRALAGQVVERADLRWPSVPDVDLTGSVTTEVVARGKHILHRFDTGSTLHTHLRMEGQWRIEHPGPDTERALRRQDLRAAVLTATWSAVGLRLGMLDLVPTAREADLVGHLGPDVLGPDWDPDEVTRRVTGSPRLVGDVLLDQRVLAGVGTFWGSELLFIERINPWTPADTLDPGGRAPPPRPAAPPDVDGRGDGVAGQHRDPARRRGGLRPRALGSSVPPVRRHGPRRDDGRGPAPAHPLLVPDLPGRPRAHRRRQAAATARHDRTRTDGGLPQATLRGRAAQAQAEQTQGRRPGRRRVRPRRRRPCRPRAPGPAG